MSYKIPSSIRDNQGRGKVGDFLKDNIHNGTKLSIVSAYFTIYAYEQLKDKLHGIDHLNFLYGEPTSIKKLDRDKTETKYFEIVDKMIALKNRLQQKIVAKECSEWI